MEEDYLKAIFCALNVAKEKVLFLFLSYFN